MRPIGVRVLLENKDEPSISGIATGVLARRGTSGRSKPSKGGAGVAASMVDRIGTVKTGSMEGRRGNAEGEVIRGGRVLRAVRAGH